MKTDIHFVISGSILLIVDKVSDKFVEIFETYFELNIFFLILPFVRQCGQIF
jgi:hypothetical protein